jgi:predicted ATPase
MSSSCFAAFALWHLGYPDQALKRSQAAVSLAQEVAHPFSLAYALCFAALCHQLRREEQRVEAQAEAGLALSTEHGVPIFLAQSTIFHGWALSEQGQGTEGLGQMRRGLAAFQATGAEILLPFYLALLAEAFAKVGQVEEGLSTLAEALTLVNKTGERNYEAELYRLRGELTLVPARIQSLGSSVTDSQSLNPDPQGEAEGCFLKAIEIAQKQHAKSLELRAVMSLARLWQRHGKQTDGWQRLTEIYAWFTEGFETADMQDAKALLAELSEGI